MKLIWRHLWQWRIKFILVNLTRNNRLFNSSVLCRYVYFVLFKALIGKRAVRNFWAGFSLDHGHSELTARTLKHAAHTQELSYTFRRIRENRTLTITPRPDWKGWTNLRCFLGSIEGSQVLCCAKEGLYTVFCWVCMEICISTRAPVCVCVCWAIITNMVSSFPLSTQGEHREHAELQLSII